MLKIKKKTEKRKKIIFSTFRPILYRSLEVSYSSRARVMSYLMPTFLASVILNIPKFLEAKIDYFNLVDEHNNSHSIMTYNVTSLRVDPDYMYYYIHWVRLVTTGLVPFSYLVYMNMRIYTR